MIILFVFVVAGLFLGGIFGGAVGAALGAAIGYLYASQLSIQEQLSKLESQLNSIVGEKGGKEESSSEKLPVTDEDHHKIERGELAEDLPSARSSDQLEPEPEPEIIAEAKVVSTSADVVPEKVEATYAVESEHRPASVNPVTAFLTGGNTAVRIGIIVLFFGIAFLLKYAIDHNKLPIQYRLISTSIGAIIMLVIGWRLREKRPGYALTMQGGAVGILYLVVFASLRLYHLLPPAAAFSLLVAIAAFSAMLAILQNSMALAVFGVVGGFLAPILTSTGSGNHVLLFSYYSVLNIGILAIAWFKSWRILNLVGFGFTFVIASMWGYSSYAPEHFSTTEPFLIFFVGLYVLIAILFATRQKPDLIGYVDGPIVFATPTIGFALQSQLVSQYQYGLAWSALGLGLFYTFLATILFKRHSENLKTLVRSFLGIGVLFGTLVIPLAFDGRVTSAIWAMEGAAAIWIGIKQGHRLPRWFGIFLFVGSSLAFIIDTNAPVGLIPVLNSFYIGCLIISFAAMFSSFQYYRNSGDIDPGERNTAHVLLLVLGLVWWFFGGVDEIIEHVVRQYRINSLLVFVTLSCAATVWISRKLDWKPISYTALGLLPAMVITAIALFVSVKHPLVNGGYISWVLALATYYGLLRGNEKVLRKNILEFGHAISFWLVLFLASWQAHWGVSQIKSLPPVWLEVTLALIPAIFVYAVTQLSKKDSVWPFGVQARTYLELASIPVLALLWIGAVFISLTNTGDVWPLPYIPILNPLDLTQLLVFIVAFSWYVRVKPLGLSITEQNNRPMLYGLGAGTIFLWLNAVLIRTIHHWVGVPFRFSDMFNSVLVQTSVSIFWSLLGLAAMVLANRYQKRIVWYSGSILLAVVVVKLFLVDLSQSGTIERIVSFIVVGILLLVVGYFTPMPPKQSQAEVNS